LAVIGPPTKYSRFQKGEFKSSAAITNIRVTVCFYKSVAYKITGTVPFSEQKFLEIADE